MGQDDIEALRCSVRLLDDCLRQAHEYAKALSDIKDKASVSPQTVQEARVWLDQIHHRASEILRRQGGERPIDEFEESLESAYWQFDSHVKRKGRPMEERDAFKCAVRWFAREAL